MSDRSPTLARTLLALLQLESRLTPALSPIAVPNWTGSYNVYVPTILNPLTSAVDPNPGSTLDFSTITIVTPPTKGQLSVDPTSGAFQYTPNYLLPAGLPKGAIPTPIIPESFKFTVKDNLGAMSNIVTATFSGSNAPTKGGLLIARDGGAVTNTLQPVTIDLLSYIDTFEGVQVDPNSVVVDGPPVHGTASYDPATGRLTYTPDFGYSGPDGFHYTVSDTTGVWHSFADDFVLINTTAAPRMQVDPLGGTMLVVDGTPGDDTILVTPGKRPGDVTVSVNGVVSGPFHPTGRVVVLGYGGNDRIQVSESVRSTAWLAGGAGNDVLLAGGGPSVLLGGNGNDILASGRGRDLMVGGAGSDTLLGNGDDILVPGTTSYDTNQSALNAVAREWNSPHTYAQRVLNLSGQFTRKSARRLNGDIFLTNTTVFDDGEADTLAPGGFESLIFPTRSVSPPGVADTVLDARPSGGHHPHQAPAYTFPSCGHRGGVLLAHARHDYDWYGDRIASGGV